MRRPHRWIRLLEHLPRLLMAADLLHTLSLQVPLLQLLEGAVRSPQPEHLSRPLGIDKNCQEHTNATSNHSTTHHSTFNSGSGPKTIGGGSHHCSRERAGAPARGEGRGGEVLVLLPFFHSEYNPEKTCNITQSWRATVKAQQSRRRRSRVNIELRVARENTDCVEAHITLSSVSSEMFQNSLRILQELLQGLYIRYEGNSEQVITFTGQICPICVFCERVSAVCRDNPRGPQSSWDFQ